MSASALKAFFPNASLPAIATRIRETLRGRRLGEIMELETSSGELVVRISKVGTTVLRFSAVNRDGGTECTLTEEKLALAHRPFRDEVKQKLRKVVEQAGGQVLQFH